MRKAFAPTAPPVPRPVAARIKALRRQQELSQADFVQTFALAIGALRDWEQGG